MNRAALVPASAALVTSRSSSDSSVQVFNELASPSHVAEPARGDSESCDSLDLFASYGSQTRPAPRLVVRALVVSFLTVTVILSGVFVLISLDIRQRVRQTVTDNLNAGQQLFVQVERQRQQQLITTIATVAETPTLKAALDIWQTEGGADEAHSSIVVATMQREVDKIATRLDADVVAVLDVDGHVVVSAGRRAPAWTRGVVLRSSWEDAPASRDYVAVLPSGAFRVIGVPLMLGDVFIGTLELGRTLEYTYARELAALAQGHSAILIGQRVIATTLPPAAASDLASVPAATRDTSVVNLAGESYAVRHLDDAAPAIFLTLASIDAAAGDATRSALTRLAWIGVVALALTGMGTLWLARTLTRPIDRLSASIGSMTLKRQFDMPLPLTGTSRELDALAETFNALIRAVSEAEAQTQAAYLGAIRALATALDARDPYTAGHSERVSALAVEMGRAMGLADDELGTLRLAALLHDIGKIGVPDDVLGKPSALSPDEFELIRAHPVIGARILRSIPFLAPHLPIVELHHERPDGRGYPHGLIGEAIPLAARIVHVADAYDAMTSARAYRPARSSHEAIAELHRQSGVDFDTAAVRALVSALPKLSADLARLDPMAFQFATFSPPPRTPRVAAAPGLTPPRTPGGAGAPGRSRTS